MFAQVVYRAGGEAELRLYRSQVNAKKDIHNDILRIPLTNEQLTELVLTQGIKAVELQD